jgi:hypothetical protein
MFKFAESRSAGKTDRTPTVVALHCSGAAGYEWRHLTQTLPEHVQVIAPDLIGCGGARWRS